MVPDRTPITQADGTVTYTAGRGSIDFGAFGILPDCYYAPEFEYNLLSVPHLNSFGFSVTFNGTDCLATGPDGTTHRIAELRRGLYLAPMSSCSAASAAPVSQAATYAQAPAVSRTVRFDKTPAAANKGTEQDEDDILPPLLCDDSDDDDDEEETPTTHHSSVRANSSNKDFFRSFFLFFSIFHPITI